MHKLHKILLMQRMHQEGMRLLEEAGYEVVIPGDTSEEALKKIVGSLMRSSYAVWFLCPDR
jgi:hypothetical protein